METDSLLSVVDSTSTYKLFIRHKFQITHISVSVIDTDFDIMLLSKDKIVH